MHILGKVGQWFSKYREYTVGPHRTWSGVATFGLVLVFLLTFAAGVGATNGRVLGPEAVNISSVTAGTSGILHHMGLSNRPARDRLGTVLQDQPRSNPARHHHSLATALATAESFTFNGKTAVTSYDRYRKDDKDGWIWGNSARFSTEQQRSLEATVRLR